MLRSSRIDLSILVFVLSMAVGLICLRLLDNQRSSEHRLTTQAIGTGAANTLEMQLARSLSPTYTLSSMIREFKTIDHFDALAAEMIETQGGIDSLQLAQDGIVSQIYPLEGNEAAIGHNLLKDPQRRSDAYKAIDSRKLTLAGPFELIQGGFAVIGRLPVFVVAENEEERFWGFTISLIRVSTLIETSQLDDLANLGYAYELTRIHPETGKEARFYPSSSAALFNKTSFPVTVPNGQWTLTISPTQSANRMFMRSGILIVTAIAMIITLLATRRREFQVEREDVRQATRWRFATIVLTVTMIVLFTWGLEVLEKDRIELARRSNVLSKLSTVRAKLEEALNTRLYLMRGMMAHVAIHADIDVSEFQELAAAIAKNETGIRSIQLAKDTVVSHVYPLAGNEQAVGLRLLELPLQRPAVERAIHSGTTVVAGPVNLVQGGVAFISRTPIYLKSTKESVSDGRYWGLATVLISRDSLFEEAGLFDSASEIQIAIRGKDGLGAEGKVFYGDEATWQMQPVTLNVNLPNGSWQLAATPIKGWDAGAPRIWWIRAGGVTIASLTGILLWFLVTYQLRVQESEKRFRAMVENLPAGTVYVKNATILMNQGMEKMTGYKRSELTTVDQWFNVLFGSGMEEAEKQYREDARAGFPIARELTIIDRDGKQRALNFAGYKDPSHEIWLIEDITDRKRHEKQRKILEIQHLQSQKLETIGTLAGGVAHEINNPLNGIMSYAQLINERLDPESPLRKFAEGIGRETERVAEIVRNLLAFARQEKDSHSPVVFSDILNNTLSLIRTIIRRDQITLNVDVPDDLPQLKCRSQQIQQVLMNLLTNARDALNTRYSVHDPDKVMTVTVRPFTKEGRPWIRTTVEDRGLGIPDEIASRMFDPFFTTKDRSRGTGLGLSISHGIVQDHHGKLYFESEAGQFTRFHLDLPADNG